MTSIDTSEKGLEKLIVEALTGSRLEPDRRHSLAVLAG